jgi:hypothetical protein
MGAIKIAARGTQNHRFSETEFEQRFEASFGRPIRLKAIA